MASRKPLVIDDEVGIMTTISFQRFPVTARQQSGRSPKVVALFSATNFSSIIIEFLQLHDTNQIKSTMI